MAAAMPTIQNVKTIQMMRCAGVVEGVCFSPSTFRRVREVPWSSNISSITFPGLPNGCIYKFRSESRSNRGPSYPPWDLEGVCRDKATSATLGRRGLVFGNDDEVFNADFKGGFGDLSESEPALSLLSSRAVALPVRLRPFEVVASSTSKAGLVLPTVVCFCGKK